MTERPDFPYSRLPGTLRGFIRRATLWEGPDHLLSISGTRFAEQYRRFYYRDVEAVFIRKCPRAGSIGVWVLSALVMLIAAFRVARVPHAPFATAILWAMIGLGVVRLVLALRYSCRVHIQTAVSREELPSLLRTWNAEKTLARVRARIAEVQGSLPAELANIGEAAADSPEPAAAEIAPADAASGARGVKLAIAAFILLLVDAAQSFWLLHTPARGADNNTWMRVFTIVLVMGQTATLAPALVSIHRLKALRSLRTMLVITLAFLALEVWCSLYFHQVYGFETALRRVPASFEYAWHWVEIFAGSGAVILGIGGLILILLNWETYKRGDASTV